jgi:hypothetical protein
MRFTPDSLPRSANTPPSPPHQPPAPRQATDPPKVPDPRPSKTVTDRDLIDYDDGAWM